MTRNIFIFAATAALTLMTTASTQAAPIAYWDNNGFEMIDDDEGVGARGFVDPGWGGQDFDAEYLFYRYNKATTTLTIGIQTGFDLIDGHIRVGRRDYYAGDLALTFDRFGSRQFAVDFGFLTRNYNNALVDAGSGNGIDAAGVYEVSSWNNDIAFPESAPFAMDGGAFVTDITTDFGYDAMADSYYRTVTFDYSNLGLDGRFNFNAHWTMSCGNDVVAGEGHVPVPGVLPLMALGLLILRRIRRG